MSVFAFCLQPANRTPPAYGRSLCLQKTCLQVNSLTHRIAICTLSLPIVSFACIGLYILKSALGIDLFDGPSVFHDAFYPLS